MNRTELQDKIFEISPEDVGDVQRENVQRFFEYINEDNQFKDENEKRLLEKHKRKSNFSVMTCLLSETQYPLSELDGTVEETKIRNKV
jgi:hypothetical protein